MAYVSNYTSLLSGYYWYPGTQARSQSVILTYSFVNEAASGSYDAANNPFYGPISNERQEWIRLALHSWASISGIIFIETKYHEGDLNFGYYDIQGDETAGDASYPASGAYFNSNGGIEVYSGESIGGVIRFDREMVNYSRDDFMHVALHEIGHALGLKHPFSGSPVLLPNLDNALHTVMSYNGYEPTLGLFDKQAIAAIYGNASNDSNYPFIWSWNASTETLFQTGTSAGEYIKGTKANDYIITGGGADAVVTYDGNDTVVASGGSLELNAGGGLDKVIENFSRYNIKSIYVDPGEEHFQVIYIGNDAQFLLGVERVHFTDGILAFDTEGNAGKVYRLYQAAFDRVPDTEGLSYWVDHQDRNVSTFSAVADSFIHSPEFERTYGTPSTVSNSEFTELLYLHTLGRLADQEGFDYWVEKLDGAHTNRGDLLAFFSESDENVARVEPVISDGIWLL